MGKIFVINEVENKVTDNDDKIDFVIAWVDGNDPDWIKEKTKYSDNPNSVLNKINRYRDWDLLRYWFRGVEKFAPWVNNIFFVSCGQRPEWLNLEHPKLKFTKHEDYIPKEYLPTFNANPIEINFHRISDLSEKFVYFNDDIFIIDEISKNDFFINDKPRYIACCDIVHSEKYEDSFPHILVNDVSILNKYYDKKEIMKNDFAKWFNLKYGLKLLVKNLSMYSYFRFSNLYEPHIAAPYLKSTFREVWKKEREILEKTSKNRFRGKEDVNQYIFKWFDIGRGNYEPSNVIGKYFDIYGEKNLLLRDIEKQKHKLICFSDDERIDFTKTQSEVKNALERILSNKSSFEL